MDCSPKKKNNDEFASILGTTAPAWTKRAATACTSSLKERLGPCAATDQGAAPKRIGLLGNQPLYNWPRAAKAVTKCNVCENVSSKAGKHVEADKDGTARNCAKHLPYGVFPCGATRGLPPEVTTGGRRERLQHSWA